MGGNKGYGGSFWPTLVADAGNWLVGCAESGVAADTANPLEGAEAE